MFNKSISLTEICPVFGLYVKKAQLYMWCVKAEQLVDICLSDEFDDDLLFHHENDQPKIIIDRFLVIHSTSQCFLSEVSSCGMLLLYASECNSEFH